MKSLLAIVPVYVFLQRLLGADLLRYRTLEAVAVEPGEVVVDVGCGPAYYRDRLPKAITYYGFDTDAGYIAWARRRWAGQGSFHCGIFDEESAAGLRPDAVLLLGLLHHLSDEDARALLTTAARILAPGGRVVALDTSYAPGQGRFSRWLSDNDRGEFVRYPEAFLTLGAEVFDSVEGDLIDGNRRIPGTYWLMRMARPLSSVPDRGGSAT